MERNWTFLRPANPDTILDSMTEEEYARDQFLPYWAELWPATEALFGHIRDFVPKNGDTVCDLGCGLGVLGAALAAWGCRTTAIDIAAAACKYAAANIKLYSPRRSHVVCGDWRQPFLRTRFDLIIAADVLYEPRWVGPVLSFIDRHLAAEGRACIADPRRASWDQFIGKARVRGYAVELRHYTVPNAGSTIETCILSHA
ncbi:MAG: methyltransferase domain-containing protein [Chitinivibrionales bacterium]|nr:methyltransferase domain-containing protein [Chitinivibrionales bacterium]